jgi:hypothetical protein
MMKLACLFLARAHLNINLGHLGPHTKSVDDPALVFLSSTRNNRTYGTVVI